MWIDCGGWLFLSDSLDGIQVSVRLSEQYQ